MRRAGRSEGDRQGHVDAFGDEPGLEFGRADLGLAFGESRRDRGPRRADPLAGVPALGAGDRADRAVGQRDRRTVAGVPQYGVSEQNLATMIDTVTPQGVVAVARDIDVPLAEVLSDGLELVLICAQVRDPGNAGTVIRCADAAGADAVILSSDSVEVYNPKTVRASVGSIFHLPVVVGVDLADAIAACRDAGLQIFATDGAAGTDLTDLSGELARPTAWVMGNESWGLPVEHLELADRTVAVPIYGKAESLNLATAAAVCLYASATAQRATS